MAGGEPRAARTPGARAALGFAVAAVAACWNPIAAPFGLLVGIAAALLAARAVRRAGALGRRLPASALALAVLAIVASLAVLAFTAGTVGVELPGEQVVKGRTPAELERALSEAGERTRAERERAARELDAISGGRPDGGSAARSRPEPAGQAATHADREATRR